MRGVFLALLAVGFGSCADRGEPVAPTFGVDGKADVADRVDVRDPLVSGAEVRSEFFEDLEFHGYPIDLRADSSFDLEITQLGSSRSTDTTLFLFGPWEPSTGYGADAIAFDDDSGWGRLSRLRGTQVDSNGRYLVVVGTHDGRGRGRYRLLATCESDACQPQSEEPSCTFGSVFRELKELNHLKIREQKVVDSSTTVSLMAETQVMQAVNLAGAGGNVSSYAEALAYVDGNTLNYFRVWDASERREYTVIEYARGDTSLGMYFVSNTSVAVATINDGDLVDCTAFRGPELTACESDQGCSIGTCEGVSTLAGAGGRCVDTLADSASGGLCASSLDCAPELLCFGLSRSPEGLCSPAWMEGRYTIPGELAIVDAQRVDYEIDVFGLATVDTDVYVSAEISHARPEDVLLTLTNPDGNEVTFFQGRASDQQFLILSEVPLPFSGDESVNGTWTLRALDQQSGAEGRIEFFSLRISSRFD